jgi:hypothetical protein
MTYFASSFRIPGNAATTQALLALENDGSAAVTVRSLSVVMDRDTTTAQTVVSAQLRVWRTTDAVASGTALSVTAVDSTDIPPAGIAVIGATASDGGALTGMTPAGPSVGEAVAGQVLAHRMHTTFTTGGQVLTDIHRPLATDLADFVIRPGERLIVGVAAAAGTSNPITNRYMVNVTFDTAGVVSLAPVDASHAQTASSPTSTQTHLLAPQSANHSHVVGTPALTQVHGLSASNARHSQSATSPPSRHLSIWSVPVPGTTQNDAVNVAFDAADLAAPATDSGDADVVVTAAVSDVAPTASDSVNAGATVQAAASDVVPLPTEAVSVTAVAGPVSVDLQELSLEGLVTNAVQGSGLDAYEVALETLVSTSEAGGVQLFEHSLEVLVTDMPEPIAATVTDQAPAASEALEADIEVPVVGALSDQAPAASDAASVQIVLLEGPGQVKWDGVAATWNGEPITWDSSAALDVADTAPRVSESINISNAPRTAIRATSLRGQVMGQGTVARATSLRGQVMGQGEVVRATSLRGQVMGQGEVVRATSLRGQVMFVRSTVTIADQAPAASDSIGILTYPPAFAAITDQAPRAVDAAELETIVVRTSTAEHVALDVATSHPVTPQVRATQVAIDVVADTEVSSQLRAYALSIDVVTHFTNLLVLNDVAPKPSESLNVALPVFGDISDVVPTPSESLNVALPVFGNISDTAPAPDEEINISVPAVGYIADVAPAPQDALNIFVKIPMVLDIADVAPRPRDALSVFVSPPPPPPPYVPPPLAGTVQEGTGKFMFHRGGMPISSNQA